MKKIFALVLTLVPCLTAFVCTAYADVSDVKLGVILLHDEDSHLRPELHQRRL